MPGLAQFRRSGLPTDLQDGAGDYRSVRRTSRANEGAGAARHADSLRTFRAYLKRLLFRAFCTASAAPVTAAAATNAPPTCFARFATFAILRLRCCFSEMLHDVHISYDDKLHRPRLIIWATARQ